MATKTLTISSEASFIWKSLKVGILRAKGNLKNVPNVQVCNHSPAPPTLPLKKFFARVYLFLTSHNEICNVKTCERKEKPSPAGMHCLHSIHGLTNTMAKLPVSNFRIGR